MRRTLLLLVLVAILAPPRPGSAQRFQPTWESLDRRASREWFDDAKFGIFIHWGLYSVPAWGPKGKYAEWYWRRIVQDREKNGEFWQFHERTYGANVRYQDFADDFRAELWEPAEWAALFKRAGARYVVLTSKHHDGFALWPSAHSWNWNSADVGPHRDLAGDLAKAVRAEGLKFGFYYSLLEWYHPLYTNRSTDPKIRRYVSEHMIPQMKDLVERYQPSILWTDGEWDHPDEVFRSTEFLAWLFNEAPNRDEVVVNDRWGKETRSRHGSFYTTEYGKVFEGDTLAASAARHKWEETRGMGASFGYNRNEKLEDYRTSRELIHLLVQTVARGGNLLLNVGPTADGRIPVIMQQRLADIGAWLTTNGEAIYGTRRWRETGEGAKLHYTRKGAVVYAIALEHPGDALVLAAPRTGPATRVSLLGHDAPLRWKVEGGRLHVEIPRRSPDDEKVRHAYVFRLDGVS